MRYKQHDLSSVAMADNTHSAKVELGFSRLTHLYLPATWVGTAITFETEVAAGVWMPVYVGTTALSMTVAASRVYAAPTGLEGLANVRLVSGSTETAGVAVLLET